MERKTLTTLLPLILVIVILGVVFFYFSRQRTDELPVEKASQGEVSEFSIGGEVVEIKGSEILLKSGWVEKTQTGNKYVRHEVLVKADQNTKIIIVNGQERINLNIENPFSYLKIADKLTVYSTDDPYDGVVSSATKIEVNE